MYAGGESEHLLGESSLVSRNPEREHLPLAT